MHARLCSLIAVLLVWVALPGVSRAQAPAAMPALPAEEAVIQDEKDPLIALGLPIVTTGVGIYMLSSSEAPVWGTGALLVLAGPSAGHAYAGEWSAAVAHTGLRAAAAGVSIAGFLGMFLFMDCGLFEEDDDCDLAAIPMLLMVGGFVVGTGSAVYSIVDAPAAASRHNRKARSHQLVLTPAPMVGPDHSAGLGLQLGGRF